MAKDKIRKIIVMTYVKGEKALKSLNRNFNKLNKSVKTIGGSLKQMKYAFAAFVSFRAVSMITKMSDEFQLLSDRITVFTGDAASAKQVFNDLTEAARHTRTSVGALATSYNRIALATQELGLSQDEILATSLALQQTFRISGSTIAEATAATIQLSQGLSSGQLRGQELRSVMEQNTIFAGMLAKELGIARGQLIKFAESGKITSDVVFRALGKGMQNLEEMASNLGTTFEQGANIILDVFKRVVYEVNKETGLSEMFGEFAMSVSENTPIIVHNVKKVMETIKGLWNAFIGLFSFLQDISLVKGFVGAVGDVVKAIWNWKSSLLELEIIWVRVANSFTNAVITIAHVFGKIKDVIYETFNVKDIKLWLAYFGEIVVDFFTSLWEDVASTTTGFFKKMFDTSLLVLVIKGYIKIVKVVVQWISKLKILKEIWQGVMNVAAKGFKAISDTVSKAKDWAKGKLGLGELADKIAKSTDVANRKVKELGKEIKKLDAPGVEKGESAIGRILKAGKGLSDMKAIAIKATGTYAALNAEIQKGAISLEQYNLAIQKIKEQKMEQGFTSGKKTLMEYYEEISKVQGATDKITEKSDIEIGLIVGIEKAMQSFGTLASDIASGVNKVFSALEDGILDFVKTGKFAFKDFATVILDELSKIIIRMAILRPMMEGIKGAMGYSSTTVTANANANGNAFHGGNIVPFANGGVVSGPTIFPMANGMGLMGEAGPEAVMPLQRNSQGKLGVISSGGGSNTYVTVINSAEGTTTETKESKDANGDKQIEVMVTNIVSKSVGEGKLDRTFNEVFGLNRRGR